MQVLKYSYQSVIIFPVRHRVLRHITNAGDELVSARARNVEFFAALLIPSPRAEAIRREPPPVSTVLLVSAWARDIFDLLSSIGKAVFHGDLRRGLPGAFHPRIIRPAERHLGI